MTHTYLQLNRFIQLNLLGLSSISYAFIIYKLMALRQQYLKYIHHRCKELALACSIGIVLGFLFIILSTHFLLISQPTPILKPLIFLFMEILPIIFAIFNIVCYFKISMNEFAYENSQKTCSHIFRREAIPLSLSFSIESTCLIFVLIIIQSLEEQGWSVESIKIKMLTGIYGALILITSKYIQNLLKSIVWQIQELKDWKYLQYDLKGSIETNDRNGINWYNNNYKSIKYSAMDPESLQFQAFLYASPPNFPDCDKHRKANLIFKDYMSILKKGLVSNYCECCGKTIGKAPQASFKYHTLQLSIYGPGVPLFFLFLKSILIFLGVYCMGFVIAASVMNWNGGECDESCSSLFIRRFSILNNKQLLHNNYVLIQEYLLLVIALYTLLQNIFLRRKMRKLQIHIDNFLVTPSDFSIILRHVQQKATRQDIQKMVGEILGFLSQDEKQGTENLGIADIINIYKLEQYLEEEKKNLKNVKNQLKKFKQCQVQSGHIVLSDVRVPDQFANTLIIIFNKSESKDFFLQPSAGIQKCIRYFWGSYYPKSSVHRLQNKFISIARAPQPDDLIWENCGKTNYFLFKRRIILYLLSFTILLCGGLAQFGIEWLRQDMIIQRQENSYSFLGYSLLMSLTITVINFVLTQILLFMVEHEKYDNKTQKKIALTTRIVYFQFLNSGIFLILISILIRFLFHDQEQKGITQTFIDHDILYFMVTNCVTHNFLMIILNYFEAVKKIKRFQIQRNPEKYTQIEANKAFQAPEIQIEFKYAYIFKTFWLTVFFMPFLPIIVLVSFASLMLNFWIQKYLFSAKYKAPEMITQQLNNRVMNLLDYTILWMTIGSFLIDWTVAKFTFNGIPQQIKIPHYILLVLSLWSIFVPHRKIIKALPNYQEVGKITKSYKQLEQSFQLRYEDTNPLFLNLKRKRNRQREHEQIQQMVSKMIMEEQEQYLI